MLDPSLISFKPVARPRLRLFCFPYAGGDANIFRDWVPAMPADVEVIGVQYPGRGGNRAAPLIDNCDDLVSTLRRSMLGLLDVDFAFFGHSNGALISFELARTLHGRRRLHLRHCFVSARVPPQLSEFRRKICQFDDRQFVDAIRAMGGTPTEVLEDERLMELLLPRLRADFAVGETHQFRPGEPLACDMTILQGRFDEAVGPGLGSRWAELTTGAVEHHLIEGGHFFLHSHRSDVVAIVRRELVRIRSTRGTEVHIR